MSSIEFTSAVLCDEIRQEASGKAILVGAARVGPAISSAKETELDRLAFYVEAKIVDVEEIKFRLKCELFDSAPLEVAMDLLAMQKMAANGDELPPKGASIDATLVFNQEKLKFPGAGVYQLQYQLGDSDWAPVADYLFPEVDD